MRKVKSGGRGNIKDHQKSMKNELKKFSRGSQGLAVLSGVMGVASQSSGNIVELNLGALENMSFTTSPDETSIYYVSASNDADDRFFISGGTIEITGQNGLLVATNYSINASFMAPGFYNIGDVINTSNFTSNLGTDNSNIITAGVTNFGDWTVDHANGAVAFRDPDSGNGGVGFLNITWDASSHLLTIKGGSFNVGTSITVTDIPEPAEYAAALGLGALGLVYYRRRPGNKSRPKS